MVFEEAQHAAGAVMEDVGVFAILYITIRTAEVGANAVANALSMESLG